MKLYGNYKAKEEKRQTIASKMVCALLVFGVFFLKLGHLIKCCAFANSKKNQMLTIAICYKTAAGTYYTLVVVVRVRW